MGFTILASTLASTASAATYRSANFIVTASSESVARQMAGVAEDHRRKFASEWLGSDAPNWDAPCRVTVEELSTGGQGWISYETYRGRAENVRIRVKGRLDHIAEYVLPHEVAHAVLAVAIGRQLPRWADEGVALLCEPESQHVRARKRAAQLAANDAIMPLSDILHLVDYPDERQHLIGFYTSSFSLSEYLVARGGKQRLLSFVHDGERHGWEASVRRHYGSDLDELESAWKSWMPKGQQPGSDLPMNVAAASPSVPSGAAQ